MAAFDGFSNFLDVKRLLWNQDYVSSSGDTAINGDPAGFAPHHFHHNHAIVRLRSGVNTVNGFCGDAYSRIKAKTKIGPRKIVVDGLGDGHYFHATIIKLQ